MCSQCQGFRERLKFGSLQEYHAWVRRLDEAVQQGAFVVTREQEVWPEMVWQATGHEIRTYLGDVIEFEFQCQTCRSLFVLWADLYHGGAGWGLSGDPSIYKR